MSERTRRFRELVEAPAILVLPGIFNGFSARLVEQRGYQAAAISGAGVSENFLGWADRGILTFDDNLRVCRALAECTTIPLLADADTGYGNALNVHFVVRAFEAAGAPTRPRPTASTRSSSGCAVTPRPAPTSYSPTRYSQRTTSDAWRAPCRSRSPSTWVSG